jgi:hypothetical protein
MPREAYGKQRCVCGHGKSIHEPESGRLKPIKRSPCTHPEERSPDFPGTFGAVINS